ncbi:MlaD family protein [Pseudonocardia bannensis]|uniref:MCE family protein n=1 Tax=Pseudonocardia bannensis TaxID=630973 RepID=A0A848DK13_9PSEU|nr:MlaD family protein [Pseudonocardia bannensis]NMH92905.1 MCE family protein [Pseudonocardia bannensis]
MTVTTPGARARGRSFLVGLATLVAIALLGYVMFTANQGRLPGAATTTVKAAFSDVGQADLNSEVRRNAQRIGSVSNIEVVGDQAVVTMTLDGNVPIYSNATAALWDQSALGQKFVELRPGDPSAGPLRDGMIPLGQTEEAHDISHLLDVFDEPTRASLRTALRELGGGTGGYGPGLNGFLGAAPGLLSDVGTVAAAAAAPEARLPAFLRSVDHLAVRFEGRSETFATLLRQTESILAAVNVDGAKPLDESLRRLPGTLTDARTALDSLNAPLADTRMAMEALHHGSQALGDATPDARGVLREAPVPLDKIPEVAEVAEPAVDEMTHTFTDARPFVPRLADGLSSAAPPLQVLAPYASDVGLFAEDISSVMAPHADFRHMLRIVIAVPSTAAVSGLGPAGAQQANPYPAPGEAANEDRDADGALIPGRRHS